jgi:hypothetical protein
MKLFLNILLIFFTSICTAQNSITEIANNPEHEHHKNEIGIANAPVYFINEKDFAYGLHLHFVRSIPKTKFGFGLGYERIFDEHKHSTIGLVGSYRPLEGLSFNISPGVTFEAGNQTGIFAIHAETAYEFETKYFHIGPAFEFAYDKEDSHLSLGLHIGFAF